MEKNFVRVRSAKDIIISLTLVIGGCLLVTLPDSDSLNILGFFTVFAGIILGFILKSEYKDPETGIRYRKVEKFFESCHKDALSGMAAGKTSKFDMCEEDKGNGLRLDIYHSKKAGKAYIQLYEYVPYKYEPCTSQHEHDIISVMQLIEKQ